MLNWNQADLTIGSIESLLQQQNVDLKFILVDNFSEDDSINKIQNNFPWIEIIKNNHNLGFAKGTNVGIMRALEENAQDLLIINNDIFADALMIDKMFQQKRNGVGIIAPLIFYHQKSNIIWAKGGNINPLLLDLIGPIDMKTPIIVSHEPYLVDFMPSCAWLVPSRIFQEIGLLDERFFIYYDDIDFCLRLKKSGYKVMVVPEAKLWHKVSMASGGQFRPRERYFMGLNSARYFRKHMEWWQVPIIIPYRVLSALKWTIRLILNKNFSALTYYWKGLYQGWINHQDK
jgi:GT2 family glycosyltransferase